MWAGRCGQRTKSGLRSKQASPRSRSTWSRRGAGSRIPAAAASGRDGGGVFAVLFWFGYVLLGSVAPLVLLFHPRLGRKGCTIAASALVVLGAFAWLFVFIIGGQAFPLEIFPGYAVTYGGSLVGFVYAFVVGYAVGRLVGEIYNRLAFPRG